MVTVSNIITPRSVKLKTLTKEDLQARFELLTEAIRSETDVMRRLFYIQERLNIEDRLRLNPPETVPHAAKVIKKVI